MNIMPPYIPAHGAAASLSGVAEVLLGALLLWACWYTLGGAAGPRTSASAVV